jgi:rhodanese-related sulfurtransferase
MDLTLLLVVAVGAFVLWNVSRVFVGKVSPDKARSLVAAGARLLDVRTPGEHASGHIEGSLNVPVQELADRLAELGDKKRPIVVYCASGIRSASAASLLKRAGFAEVHDLGAMARWG